MRQRKGIKYLWHKRDACARKDVLGVYSTSEMLALEKGVLVVCGTSGTLAPEKAREGKFMYGLAECAYEIVYIYAQN